MACASGLLAEDCAAEHWCPALGGRRGRSAWRAPCPICRADPRVVEWDISGRSIRWNSHCPQHDRPALRPVLARLLKGCLPGRSAGPSPIDHDALIALMLDDSLPPMTRRLRALELAGMSTSMALNKLGVARQNRYRVIAGTTGGVSKRIQTRRSLSVSKWMKPPGVSVHPNGYITAGQQEVGLP